TASVWHGGGPLAVTVAAAVQEPGGGGRPIEPWSTTYRQWPCVSCSTSVVRMTRVVGFPSGPLAGCSHVPWVTTQPLPSCRPSIALSVGAGSLPLQRLAASFAIAGLPFASSPRPGHTTIA